MIRLRSAAKLNLTLEILGTRADGYHELRSIVQTVGLWDEITLLPGEAGTTLCCDQPELDSSDNLCLRAARRLAEEAGVPCEVHVELKKRIPCGAGLGGGSGNAAAVLLGLARLWGLPLSVSRLQGVAAQLGADVPFFLTGGLALMEGIGDRITPLDLNSPWHFVLAKGGGSIGTAEAYASYDRAPVAARYDSRQLIELLRRNDIDKAAAMFDNVMMPSAVEACPDIRALTAALLQLGASGAGMTGSGGAVFGAFRHAAAARSACDALRPKTPFVYAAPPVAAGVEFLP